MDSLIPRLIFYQWQRKLVALLIAAIIWFLVSHSITSSKTIPSVPIRVVNLPVDKTIQGLQPNGRLTKRMTLTLQGTKDVIEQLEPGDLEIVLDVSNHPNEGVVQITKKNIVSLNPNINLTNHITSVSHPELILKLSSMITEKIPVTINPPIGEAAKGYEFLDIWPLTLTHTVSGPETQVLELKNRGLELTFNLDDISKEQLDAIRLDQKGEYHDEVSFYVPDQWKKVIIPFQSPIPEVLNDPEAKNLQVNFLYQEPLFIRTDIPIRIFYPLKYGETINPKAYPLIPNAFVQIQNDISALKVPLFAHYVSKLFLDIVKDNMEIDLVAAPPTEQEKLEWSIVFIDSHHLEDAYVAYLLSALQDPDYIPSPSITQDKERHFRQRFRAYMQKFALFLPKGQKLAIEGSLQDSQITIHVPNASHLLPPPLKKG